MIDRGSLLIIGASGRAAAASAIRAGYRPTVIDLFADEDTKRLAPVLRCDLEQYPQGFVELANRVLPMPWMYTGGLENYPDVVEAISRERTLMGNGHEVLKPVRDPFRLHEILTAKELAHPWLNHPDLEPIPHAKLLRKPIRGSAGMGIQFAVKDDVFRASDHRGEFYLQEFVIGQPMSAQCRTLGNRVEIIGVTKQLIGETWLNAPEFRYSGNLGPVENPVEFNPVPHAAAIFETLPVRGVWGFDFLATSSGSTLLEVNPRYTAAWEVFELAFGHSLLRKSFDRLVNTNTKGEYGVSVNRFPKSRTRSAKAAFFHPLLGKAIYYAPHSFFFPASGPWDVSLAHCTDVWRRPDYADIPASGFPIKTGQPVLTIFAEGATESDVLATLKSRAAELDKLFS